MRRSDGLDNPNPKARNLAQALALTRTPTPTRSPTPTRTPTRTPTPSLHQVCPGYIATDLTAGLKADAGSGGVLKRSLRIKPLWRTVGMILPDLTPLPDAGFDAVVQERNPLGRWGGASEFRGKGM